MQYDSLRYIDHSLDPSLTIEIQCLVAKVIDNTGLSVRANAERKSFFGSYGRNGCVPVAHHLGYHGIR